MNIRPLEKKDLPHLYRQQNSRPVMALWFEEPYTSFDELSILYDRHVLDQSERRFVIEVEGDFAGIVELVEIDTIHRHAEIQIIVDPQYQGQGLAQAGMQLGIEYAFNVLNLHKIYLYVDVDNSAAIHIYKKLGFQEEGQLRQHYFAEGCYHDSFLMGLFFTEFITKKSSAQ
ncbi:GNAT family N-acetyltransferase [Convivina intestini]|uniref:Diamine N-acetyltransferase n=1 Tax=Convivina intestini TaxID=1505726 RepID=A0A2U1DBL3_9LACO|nr:GNAT family N-acetyltransferase [Convivina intestini]PVY85058.1 diamine N-acetyltransferase [Convivina intestini]CAH1853551.1 Spermidine N(1)-acetyltransferase [Convivina intestini]SDB89008.1 diamine N-acetyltransferase [Leuconostocaceae bacterium R-53105]